MIECVKCIHDIIKLQTEIKLRLEEIDQIYKKMDLVIDARFISGHKADPRKDSILLSRKV